MRFTHMIGTTVATVLMLAACGDGNEGTSRFDATDLPALVLRVSEAPTTTRYAPEQSGAGALEEQGLPQSSLSVLHDYGFRSDFGRQFYGRNARRGIRSLASTAVLFDDSDGASKALAFLKDRLSTQNPQGRDLSARGLGKEAWALGGRFFPSSPPNFTAVYYAWRVDNLIQTIGMTGTKDSVNENVARALAEKVEARAVR